MQTTLERASRLTVDNETQRSHVTQARLAIAPLVSVSHRLLLLSSDVNATPSVVPTHTLSVFQSQWLEVTK